MPKQKGGMGPLALIAKCVINEKFEILLSWLMREEGGERKGI